MALSFGKKGDKKEKAATKAADKVVLPKKQKQPKQPKESLPQKNRLPVVPPDIYTLLLGLAALFFIAAAVVLGLDYYWYRSIDPAVLPMSWAK